MGFFTGRRCRYRIAAQSGGHPPYPERFIGHGPLRKLATNGSTMGNRSTGALRAAEENDWLEKSDSLISRGNVGALTMLSVEGRPN